MRLLIAAPLGLFALLVWLTAPTPLATTLTVTVTALVLFSRSWLQVTLAIVLTCIVALAAVAGLIDLKFVPQVLDLANANANPVTLLGEGRLWAPRYAVVYPSVALADQLHAGLDESFTAYGAALLVVESFVLGAALQETTHARYRDALLPSIALGAMVTGIATVMHGRLIPAHLGMSLILLVQIRWFMRRSAPLGDWLLIGVGIFLASMTTGTVVAAAAQVVFGTLLIQTALGNRGRLVALGSLAALGVAFGQFVWTGTEKNIGFFSSTSEGLLGLVDALPGLLEHGLGSLLFTTPLAALVALVSLVLISFVLLPVYANAFRRRTGLAIPLLALPIALATGEFGYSTLTMGLPAVELLVAILIQRSASLPTHLPVITAADAPAQHLQ